jgi:hypothetical protein
MLGWVNNLKGEDYRSNAKFYLKKANEVIIFLIKYKIYAICFKKELFLS